MHEESFQHLPDTARLWLLALAEAPEPETARRLLQGLEAILAQWRHKGHAYQGACALLRGRILAVAEAELAANPSGCAIDGMLKRVHRLVAEHGLGTVDPAAQVLVEGPDGPRVLAKAELAERLRDGTLGPDTPVLDLSLYQLGDLRAGRLETPLAATWIARKFMVA